MQLVTQSEMAKLAGVSSSAVNHASTTGELREARQGTRIDLTHPAAVAFIEARVKNHFVRGSGSHRPRSNNVKRHRETMHQEFAHLPEEERINAKLAEMAKDIEGLKDYTLGDLICFFGDDYRFLEWLKSLKEMENIEAKRIKNETLRGELVRRDLIHVGIFMTLDAAFRQILGDASKSLANKVESMVKAGVEQDRIVQYIRSLLGSFLQGAVDKMEKCMKEI